MLTQLVDLRMIDVLFDFSRWLLMDYFACWMYFLMNSDKMCTRKTADMVKMFCHANPWISSLWLHWKLSSLQLPAQSATKISTNDDVPFECAGWNLSVLHKHLAVYRVLIWHFQNCTYLIVSSRNWSKQYACFHTFICHDSNRWFMFVMLKSDRMSTDPILLLLFFRWIRPTASANPLPRYQPN